MPLIVMLQNKSPLSVVYCKATPDDAPDALLGTEARSLRGDPQYTLAQKSFGRRHHA